MIKKFQIGKLLFELRIEREKGFMNQVRDYIRQGLKADAVSFYQKSTGVSIDTARKEIDEIQANLVSWE
jgi:hypothetical protein